VAVLAVSGTIFQPYFYGKNIALHLPFKKLRILLASLEAVANKDNPGKRLNQVVYGSEVEPSGSGSGPASQKLKQHNSTLNMCNLQLLYQTRAARMGCHMASAYSSGAKINCCHVISAVLRVIEINLSSRFYGLITSVFRQQSAFATLSINSYQHEADCIVGRSFISILARGRNFMRFTAHDIYWVCPAKCIPNRYWFPRRLPQAFLQDFLTLGV
jgi:hypothetical protein